MRTKEVGYGLWELAVLALLREAPMHPYQMQKLLKERHKDELLVLKRGSLYHAIYRLEGAGLIENLRTSREGKRPERTTYKITTAGRKELHRWLARMIGTPVRESNEFMAALSFLPLLKVAEARERLKERSAELEKEITVLRNGMMAARAHVDRIHLIETEYLVALRAGELKWVRGIAEELQEGALKWDLKKMFARAQGKQDESQIGKKKEIRRQRNNEG